jgi:hypothetical protein
MADFTGGFFKMLGQAMTKRTSAFHNVLYLNLLVAGFCYLVYLKALTLWVFIPELFVLAYTLYSHEFFARKNPALLSGWRSVQELGVLGTMGDSTHEIEPQELRQQNPIQNPEVKQIKKGRR